MKQIGYKVGGGDEEDYDSKVREPSPSSPEGVEHSYSDGLGETMIDAGENEDEDHAEDNDGGSSDVSDGDG